MARNVLFLVHGMGVHGEGWSKADGGPIPVLQEVAASYPELRGKDLEEHIDFCEVTYDHVFERIFAHWKEHAEPLNGAVSSVSGAWDQVVEWLAEDDGEGFGRTHVADVALYYFFRFYRELVRIEVIDQIARKVTKVAKEVEEDVAFVVLAHSLGTMVAHDSLHLLATVGWQQKPDEEPLTEPFRASSFNLAGFFTAGNVTDIIHTEYSPYSSVVRPGPVSSSSANCQRYFNFRHELDPFTFPRAFEPLGFGLGFFEVPVRHFRELNVHGFGHYLRHPRVHIPILNVAWPGTAVTRDEFIEAVRPKNFPQWGGDFGTKDPEWASGLEKIKQEIGDDPDVLRWLGILRRFLRLARDLHESQED